MSRILLACFSTLLLAAVGVAQDEADVARLQLREVDKLASNPSDVQKLSHALDLCRRMLKKNPEQLDVQVRACRICWQIGVLLESEDKAMETFEIGFKLAEKIKQRHPEKPDGWYWYAVNYGQYIDHSSIFAKIGAAGKIMGHAKKTLELDPRYDSGGAYLMVGRINQIIPGGDDRLAENYFLKAIHIAPTRSTGHLYLGELYYDQKKYKEAYREIRTVLDSPPDPKFSVERKRDAVRTAELLEEIESELRNRR